MRALDTLADVNLRDDFVRSWFITFQMQVVSATAGPSLSARAIEKGYYEINQDI